MASTIAPARAAASAASRITANGVRNRNTKASLIMQMQRKLFPEQDVDEIAAQVGKLQLSPQAGPWSKKGVKNHQKTEEGRPQYVQRRDALKALKTGEVTIEGRAATSAPKLMIYPPKTPIKKTCPDPLAVVQQTQMAQLDPTGARTRLFAKTNPECARVGDILLVRQRTGEPFAGVCINIRRRGVDTAILLRGQLTRVGVEMWFKVYSPLVEGIEVVQRAQKRARRARLTYMRKPKHDRGSVENVVRVYMRQKAALGSADGKKKGAAMAAAGGKKTKGRGKKR